MIHQLWLTPDFQLESAAKNLRDRGFHHAEDPPIARRRFIELIPTLDIEWWCSSNLQPSSDSYATLPFQFQWLLERILQKLENSAVRFVFEQNSRLNKIYPSLVHTAVNKVGYDPDLVHHTIGDKQDRALAIADYCISVTSQAIVTWRESCCDISKLPNTFQYRNYARLEVACSVIYAWDLKKSLSSRTSGRLLDRSYYEVTGHHTDSCVRKTIDRVN